MKSHEIVTSVAIVGAFKSWKQIEKLCDQSVQDEAGVAVGILTRKIKTDFGDYQVKYLLLYVNEKLSHKLKPTNLFSYNELMEEGFENVLIRLGKRVIINIERNLKRKIRT